MEKIKVLLLLYSLEPGGAEKVVLSIAKHIDRKRFCPVVCAFKNGRLHPDFAKLKIPIYILNKKGGIDLSLFWKLRRVLKTENIEIIHSHNFSPNFWGRFIGYIVGIPILITTEHTLATSKTRLQKTIDHILSKITTKIIAVSNSVCNSHIREENILPDKVMTIYNGIDFNIPTYPADLLEKKRRELGINNGSKVVVAIGRLEEPKGHEYLLQAAKVILNEFHNVQLLIVGDGYLKSELIRQTNDLGIRKDVIFSGRRNDISDILTMSDIAVLSSIREGFSIALLEYMACGKPIVATDVGGNSEAIITNKSGIIVPPANHLALAAGILKLLKDEPFANRLGMEAQKRYSECFTLKHMVSGIEELYNSTLGN